jgi:hypothetical protein
MIRFHMALSVGCSMIAACAGTSVDQTPPPTPVPGFVSSTPIAVRALEDVVVVSSDATGITLAYAAGTDGTVLRYANQTWTREDTTTTANLHGIAAFVRDDGSEDVIAVGDEGTVVRRFPEGYFVIEPPSEFDHTSLSAIAFAALDDAYVVGDNGTAIRISSGAQTSLAPQAQLERPIDIRTVAADGTVTITEGTERFAIKDAFKSVVVVDNDVFIVGERGAVFRHARGSTDLFVREDSRTNRPLTDIFAGPALYAATTDGVLLVRGGDGVWSDTVLRTPAPVFLQGSWASRGDDVYAVGMAAAVYRFDGSSWLLTDLPPGTEMRAVAGATFTNADGIEQREAFAVGAHGLILRGPTALPRAGETLLVERQAESEEEP